MKSYSQAAQDRFVHKLIVEPEQLKTGTFLDIGCCHPTEISNTFGLEEIGWLGILFDIDPNACELCRQKRRSPVVEGNAVTNDYRRLLLEGLWNTNEPIKHIIPFRRPLFDGPLVIDYLSLDIDSGTDDVLAALPLDSVRFRIITLEHDAYRFGDRPRRRMRDMLKAHGYDLVCSDVCSLDMMPYEDWFVHPGEIPFSRWENLICNGKSWQEIPL
jgi:hypothetical protein